MNTPQPLQPPSSPPASSHEKSDLFGKVEELINKLPKLPWNLEKFPKWIPWVQLILILLILPFVLLVLGIQAILLPLLPFAEISQPGTGMSSIIYTGLIVAELVIGILALPGLFKRTLRGWKLVFLSALISGITQVINGEIVSLIFTVLWLRILTQAKVYYHAQNSSGAGGGLGKGQQ